MNKKRTIQKAPVEGTVTRSMAKEAVQSVKEAYPIIKIEMNTEHNFLGLYYNYILVGTFEDGSLKLRDIEYSLAEFLIEKGFKLKKSCTLTDHLRSTDYYRICIDNFVAPSNPEIKVIWEKHIEK